MDKLWHNSNVVFATFFSFIHALMLSNVRDTESSASQCPRGGGNGSRADGFATTSSSANSGSNAQHESSRTSSISISAEVGDCQPVEETELPAVPVVRPVHEPIVARHSLGHSAELAMITIAIPPVVCATPKSSRRDDHHGMHHGKYLKRLA